VVRTYDAMEHAWILSGHSALHMMKQERSSKEHFFQYTLHPLITIPSRLAQDDFCEKAESGLWDELKGKDYPQNLQWEMLVDVLRGRVKAINYFFTREILLIFIARFRITATKPVCISSFVEIIILQEAPVDLDDLVRVSISMEIPGSLLFNSW